MEKIIALTGTTGAMGGEVLLSLLTSPQNFKVKCILRGGKKMPSFVKNIFKKYSDRIVVVSGDISKIEDCRKLLEGVDYLINCASLIPPKSDHNPKGTYLSNYLGTKNLVDAALELGNKIAFVQISTVALYGNRTYPHVWGRVGDPIISSDYDTYSMYKMKAERYVLESGLNKFVSLRQTAVLHKYMFKNNLKDGLMFHTSYNCPLEWVTDEDSGYLLKNLVEQDAQDKLNGFWNRIYNIGGGEKCRVTGYDSLNDGFKMMGAGADKFFKPNWNITRNFHGVWFYDSDELENILHFRRQTYQEFWTKMSKKYWYFKLGKLVPPPIISSIVFKKLFKNTNAPMYWIKHNKVGRIRAFFKSREDFDKIPKKWKDFPLLKFNRLECGNVDYNKLRDINNAKDYLLDHGYDESIPLDELTFFDLQKAAEFRGGKCLEKDYVSGNIHKKIKWQCFCGEEFSGTVYSILKGGYFCPKCCEPKPWRYGFVAKNSPFYAQVYFDTHTQEEVDDVYPLFESEDDFMEDK